MNIQPAEPSDLIQQLEDLRWTNEKEAQRDGWSNNQVDEYLQDTNTSFNCLVKSKCPLLSPDQVCDVQVSLTSSPAVTFDPPAWSEVFQAELEQLKRTVVMLEAELTQLEAQVR